MYVFFSGNPTAWVNCAEDLVCDIDETKTCKEWKPKLPPTTTGIPSTPLSPTSSYLARAGEPCGYNTEGSSKLFVFCLYKEQLIHHHRLIAHRKYYSDFFQQNNYRQNIKTKKTIIRLRSIN